MKKFSLNNDDIQDAIKEYLFNKKKLSLKELNECNFYFDFSGLLVDECNHEEHCYEVYCNLEVTKKENK